MPYDVGDVVPSEARIRDASGNLADGGTVTCLVTCPDGSTVTPPVHHAATGVYQVGVVATMAGLHAVDWSATGVNASAYQSTFTVRDPARLPVVSLADAKAFLNITGTDSDAELRDFCDVVTYKGEEFTGRVFGRRTIVATVDGTGGRLLAVPTLPVLTLTSVAIDGTAVDTGDLVVHGTAGIIDRGYGNTWPTGSTIVVTYVAGYTLQPASDVMGAKMLLRWLWQTQRGSVRRGAAGNEWMPGEGFDLPNAVVGQWRDQRVTGFA